MGFLKNSDLEEIFSSSFLYENQSFYSIEPTSKTYQTDKVFNNFIEYAESIRNDYSSGRTIIVKNLEKFSQKIKVKSLQYGLDVDVHMYLVPPYGTDSFPFHLDDKDVTILMVYGHKEFQFQNEDKITSFSLAEGDELFIPKTQIHCARPLGPSCLLSFGNFPIHNYVVPGGLRASDFPPTPTNDESRYTNL